MALLMDTVDWTCLALWDDVIAPRPNNWQQKLESLELSRLCEGPFFFGDYYKFCPLKKYIFKHE